MATLYLVAYISHVWPYNKPHYYEVLPRTTIARCERAKAYYEKLNPTASYVCL